MDTTGTECLECPEHGICYAGSTLASIVPAANYYAVTVGSDVFMMACVNDYCCSNENNGCEGNVTCAVGYTGALCGECMVGYGQAGPNECSKCPSYGVNMFWLIMASVLLCVGCFFFNVAIFKE